MARESEAVRELMADGIATAVAADGDVPIRWLAVVETLDENGGRCMWRMTSDGMSPWDVMTLHEYSMTKLRGQLMREELGL